MFISWTLCCSCQYRHQRSPAAYAVNRSMWQFSCYLNPLNRVWLGVQELAVLWVVWFLTSGNAHGAYHCCLALVLFAFSATPSPPTSWMWFFSSCLRSHFWNGAKIKFPDASNNVHFKGLFFEVLSLLICSQKQPEFVQLKLSGLLESFNGEKSHTRTWGVLFQDHSAVFLALRI